MFVEVSNVAECFLAGIARKPQRIPDTGTLIRLADIIDSGANSNGITNVTKTLR